MRLLQDITARTLYELPDYDGPADHDVLLQELIDNHCTCGPWCKHANVQPGIAHVGNLLLIEDRAWEKRKTEIAKEIWRDYPDMGDEDILQSMRNTYVEDAAKCFNKHQRPKQGCIDYCDSNKRIGNPSKSQYLAEKKPIYLCQFCPVHTWVTTELRHKAGLYN